MDLKEKRREEIIRAAMKVFSKNGFEGSKMEVIAAEAGIGKGTIYEYFASKQQLFEEMICFNIDQYKIDFKEIITAKQGIDQKIKNLCYYHAKFLNAYLDIFRLTSHGGSLSHSMRKQLIGERNSILSLLKGMLDEAASKGEVRQDIDTEAAVMCILGAIMQLTGKRVFQDKVGADDIDPGPLVDILLFGLANGRNYYIP